MRSKEDESLNSHIKSAILTCVGLTAFMAIIPPAAFGGAGGAAWAFVDKYQTLITGLAAVGAATWTIRVMEKTDKRQEDRHRELVDLSLRSDRLRIDRVVFPQLGELAVASREFFDATQPIKEFTILAPPEHLNEVFENAVRPLHAIKSIMTREVWEESRALFGGYLAARIDVLIGLVQDALNAAQNVNFLKSQILTWDSVVVHFEDAELEAARKRGLHDDMLRGDATIQLFLKLSGDVVDAVDRVVSETRALARRYDVLA